MFNEIGHFALVLATFVAALQMSLPLYGAQKRIPRLMALAAPMALVQLGLIAVVFASLVNAFVTSDFSLYVVAVNSHTDEPLLYKATGVWGNHEGSMVLWVSILAVFGALVAIFGGRLPAALRARVLSVQGMIGFGFLLFIVTTSNPFRRLIPPPPNGQVLNPLLQDPGLAFHPPFLYLGYVGFSMAFAFAVAAMIEGRVDPAWARWVRPWTLFAWCCLTVGIAGGSWWAYYELGWGGFWFWDPVENASFMPWLIGTALLHSSIVVEKRDALKSWTILLAILTFSLSLIGTFLVRSGVLTSVHAFAVDPARGIFILGLLAVAIGGSLILYGIRAPLLKEGGLFAPISREGGLVLNNLLLTCGAAIVLVGTLYPLVLDVFGGDKVSVGPPYFNAAFGPVIVPLFLAVPLGPMLAWKRADLLGVLQRLWFAGVAALVATALALYAHSGGPVLAIPGMGLAAWLVVGALVEWAERVRLFRGSPVDVWRRAWALPRSSHGMTLAHAGLGIVLAGIIGTTVWKVEKIQAMRPGESIEIAGYGLTFQGVVPDNGPNYQTQRGTFILAKGGQEIARMYPEKRFYPVQQMPTTEAAIRSNGFADLYVVLGDPQDDGSWATRIYLNPLAPWLWAGAMMMALGGGISLTDRRFRIGAPALRRLRLPAGAAPAAE
ncbi:MAG: heme lyase CcmF/NrfE family subunit [Alphaproteobacteria bacterium]